ncbi:MAG: hypothetical protein H6667_00710 [Ardenticatenaceae bacterium]|nr:hypothetical protein [Ardenticatenaceae bacterium]
MKKPQYLQDWLETPCDIPLSTNPSHYIFRLLKENHECRNDKVIDELKNIIQKAHEDAKRKLRRVAEFSLDPLETKMKDPTIGYPEMLDIVTLQGYFGEIFAGVIAENYDHFGENSWEVPAYPFRFHNVAFSTLENWRQTGKLPKRIPGRTGDDMLAFLKNKEGKITRALVCEAKCTRNHDSRLISDVHKKASSANPKPVDLMNLIEILRDYEDEDSKNWENALRELYHRNVNENYERVDLVAYICGKSPVRNLSHISPEKPHDQYTAKRKLEAVEVHLKEIKELVQTIYDVPSK